MSITEIVLSFVIALLIGLFAAYLFWAQRKFAELEGEAKVKSNKAGLQLTAYERLTILTERLKITNMAKRLLENGLTARQLQQNLLIAMNEELDHNITQQLYVKKEIWDAVTKMKIQNSLIINQIATTLPVDEPAVELSKRLVQFCMENPNATMNHLVLDAIQYEAKQLL